MSVRFYLSDLAGTGATLATAFRPAMSDLLGHGQARSVDGRANGTAVSGRTLVWHDVSNAQHTTLIADARITWLPFATAGGTPLGPNNTLGEISSGNLTLLRTRLDVWHVPTDDLTGAVLISVLLRRIVRRLLLRQVLRADDFSEGLDTLVSAAPAAKRTRINTALQAKGFDTSAIVGTDTIREALRKLAAQDIPFFRGT